TVKEARQCLNNVSGVYCIVNTETETIYIGSAVNLYDRLYDHLINHGSNLYLQRAIVKYGLAVFVFKVIEQCSTDQLLAREQHWLGWLFFLPVPPRDGPCNDVPGPRGGSNFHYNFISKAGAAHKGMAHSKESKAKLSDACKGKTVSPDTRRKLSEYF